MGHTGRSECTKAECAGLAMLPTAMCIDWQFVLESKEQDHPGCMAGVRVTQCPSI